MQGTLYPDVIESVSVGGPSATIKTHHNVGGLPETMKMALVEPLRELFKDEVRAVGRTLGLPERAVGRHPSFETLTGYREARCATSHIVKLSDSDAHRLLRA